MVTQNANTALQSYLEAMPKHLCTSLQIVPISIALSVIQRNSGNVGLLFVLESLSVTKTDLSQQL